MAEATTRPVPTQAENDALITGQMHPDDISNPGQEAEEKRQQHYQPEERAPGAHAPAPAVPAPGATPPAGRRTAAESEKPAE